MSREDQTYTRTNLDTQIHLDRIFVEKIVEAMETDHNKLVICNTLKMLIAENKKKIQIKNENGTINKPLINRL